MEVIILCGIIATLVLIIIVLMMNSSKDKKIIESLENKQLKYQKQQQEDKKYKENIMIVSNILNNHIYEYNELGKEKITKDIKNKRESLERNIKEDYNNLNVICNPYDKVIPICKVKTNLLEEFNLLKKEYESCNKELKLNFHIINGISEYLKIDTIKLMSVMRILIDNVMTYNPKNEIEIEICNISSTRKKQRLLISIDDVNFKKENPNMSVQDISDYLNGKEYDKVDYKLKLIKENILYMNGKACLNYGYIDNRKEKLNFGIDITLEKIVDDIYAIVVDDMEQLAKMNQEVLKEINIESDIVFSGKECIKMIKENPDKYDIVFTDNQMPQMTGPELLKKLRKLKDFDLPVVIVTSDSGLEEEFKNHGFDDYIVKPMKIEDAKEAIKKLI